MQDLSVTIIQSSLHWENIVANLAMFEEKIRGIKNQTDVIVLPEMFTTGFSMNAKTNAEAMNLQTTKWMKMMADQTGALLLGSFIATENGRFFNRLVWMEPGGKLYTYDKRHLFRMANENDTYSAGSKRLTSSWKGWNICPLVCYDLRFPVWSRNQWDKANGRMKYDILIYVANWPKARVLAWDTLLKARAIENLSYVVGVNRTGDDGLGIAYNGHSAILGLKGETVYAADESEIITTVSLSAGTLSDHRKKFPAYLDADDFTIS